MILTKALSFYLRGVNQLYKRFNLKLKPRIKRGF